LAIIVHLHGVSGRTRRKLTQHDLSVTSSLSPSAVILEIGTKDLSDLGPKVIPCLKYDAVFQIFFLVRMILVLVKNNGSLLNIQDN